jgi:hypothetical protein
MGPSIFAGVVIMVMLMPVNTIVGAILRRFQIKVMAKKDTRIKMINEVLNGIKVSK